VKDTNILQLGLHLKLEIGMKIKSLKLNIATNYYYRFSSSALQPVADPGSPIWGGRGGALLFLLIFIFFLFFIDA